MLTLSLDAIIIIIPTKLNEAPNIFPQVNFSLKIILCVNIVNTGIVAIRIATFDADVYATE